MTSVTDTHFMKLALAEARKAFDEGEIPIGAVIVSNGKVIASAHNMTEALTDVTAHAEMLAITAAQSVLGKYLGDATLYVTVEPCTMCAGAIGWARPARVVYGAPEPKVGYTTRMTGSPFHPKTIVTTGVMLEECADLMQKFFKQRR